MTRAQIVRAAELLDKRHCLDGSNPVGDLLWYAAITLGGEWLGVLLFTAASHRLRQRGQWIGRNDEQRRRRLPVT